MEEKQQTVKLTNPVSFALSTGFFAGVIWGAVYIIFYYLGFTRIIPGFLAEPFFAHDTLASWNGHLIGWLFFILFSILASFVYALLFRKVKGPWFSAVYGILWWIIVFLGFGPGAAMMSRADLRDLNTLLSTLCLFILWGMFIGYTITFEFTDERIREPFGDRSHERQ